MSYGFSMGFAHANSLQEAMKIALECKHLSARLCCHEVPEKRVFEPYHGKYRARLR